MIVYLNQVLFVNHAGTLYSVAKDASMLRAELVTLFSRISDAEIMKLKLQQCVKMCDDLLLKIRKSEIYKKQQFSKIVIAVENLPPSTTPSMSYQGIVLLFIGCVHIQCVFIPTGTCVLDTCICMYRFTAVVL